MIELKVRTEEKVIHSRENSIKTCSLIFWEYPGTVFLSRVQNCVPCATQRWYPWGILKWPYAITWLTTHLMCGLMSDLVICKFTNSMVIHGTECSYWDQLSLCNTNQTKPNQTKPKLDIPLFATNANSIQLYHSPMAKILPLQFTQSCTV